MTCRQTRKLRRLWCVRLPHYLVRGRQAGVHEPPLSYFGGECIDPAADVNNCGA